ncbi:hypothetical protein BJ878DRAFT_509901 [Calycina marina]|uniref:Transcription elongation factor SPT5 n=1 Tax=Calycina marina TaxID=1763456 RepID=A0A9P7Z2D4_9HELO|nr:hypothetical protein BJ878DRAFT_509901 [Calycina marina]
MSSSTAALLDTQFDNSEEEEDFKLQPVDTSDDGASDNETAPPVKSKRSEPNDEDEDDEGEGEDTAPKANDDDDEEDEEDDEEEEEDIGRSRKRRRGPRNMFVEDEAEVDEDEEDNEDDEDEHELIKDGFIDPEDNHDDLPVGGETDDRRHRELDRRRELEASMDAEKQAEILRQRYSKPAKGRGLGPGGNFTIVPKRLLLPSVEDPSIWAVRCKEGKEREAIFSIMKRIEERKGTKQELAITCAFERGGTHSTMKGYIYVEAHRQADVMTAMDGLVNVYPRTKMILVEIKEMPDLLRVTKSVQLDPGAYVRLRRPPKYANDLAQVIDVTDTGLEVRVRYVPRLDYGMNEEMNATDPGKRKRPVAGPRPPQRLFSEVEAKKRHGRFLQNRGDKTFVYQGEDYVNGYCEKEVKIQLLITKDVNPKLEEVTRFISSGAEDGTENLDLNALAASLKHGTINASYLPGDVIEVYEGEQKGIRGKAISIQGDIVTMHVEAGPLKGQTIEVPVKGLRKRFREGDHVKVIGGSRFRDEVGMVVKIVEDRVTFLSDQGHNEITVFSKDLREASDSGGGGSLGQFDLWDLIQLDPSTVACITKVERESLIVLDQNAQVRTVLPSQITNKIDQRRNAVATDRDGAEVRTDDVVKEVGGEGKSGGIMHIHRAYLFCRSSEGGKNGGVFVARTTNVKSVSAKGGRIANQTPDLTSMNPATKRNANAGGDMPPPKSFGRDKAIGQTVTIKRGPHKGLLGIVKETTDTHARVELHTKSKVVNVLKEYLGFKDKVSGQSIDPNQRGGYSGGGRGGFTPRGGRDGPGGATPGNWAGGRTPMPAASHDNGRTPAWGSSRTPAVADNGGRTPAWKSGGDGGRTPGWAQDGSRTANPYDGNRTSYGAGNRTPAWAATAKTPAYSGGSDAFNPGSKTPGYAGNSGSDSWGSKTPAYQPQQQADNNGSWGQQAPPVSNWNSNAYDAPTPGAAMSAPTPAAMNAPTPSAYSAPTPAPYSAPTPAAAPIPAAHNWSGNWGAAQPMDAPTPGGGQQGYYGAPTPGYGAPETPAPGWQDDGPRYTDS